MDTVHIQKLKAMNKYKKTQFLSNFIFYCFTTITFCSIPLWFPTLYYSTKAFLFVSLPNIGVLFFNPKCLFIVCNIIVVFLIGESRLVSKNSSPDADIYDEYVKRTSSFRKEEKEVKESEVVEMGFVEESERIVSMVEEVEGEVMEVKKDNGEEEEIENEQVENLIVEEEEEVDVPAEELNKKVEEFIAKINKQRRLEAKQLVCINSRS